MWDSHVVFPPRLQIHFDPFWLGPTEKKMDRFTTLPSPLWLGPQVSKHFREQEVPAIHRVAGRRALAHVQRVCLKMMDFSSNKLAMFIRKLWENDDEALAFDGG